jgi:hypothetical protein
MWNAQTGKIYESRDVIWLRRMFYSKSVEEDDDDFIVSVPAPEFEEAAAPKDGEGNKTKAEKFGQLFTDLTANENTQSGGATGTALKQQEEDADSLNSSSESESSNESESMPSDEDEEVEETTTTRSGRAVRPPERFRDTAAASFDTEPSPAEQRIFQGMKHCYEISMANIEWAEMELHKYAEPCPFEVQAVGMGIGGDFGNTAELHVKNYREAMAADDKEKWKEAIHEEYERMQQHGVFEPVLISTLPPIFRRIDSTWAMKHKASGKY